MSAVLCMCLVAVYQRPLMLQPSLPTYICSFASPAAATASTNVMPCIPSSTMLGSALPNVLWSPTSSDIVTLVTQRAGVNCSVSQSAHELTVPSSRIIPPVNRSATCSDRYGDKRRAAVQSATTSGMSELSTSHQPTASSVEDLAGRLVASLPSDVVKSLLESESSRQTVEMLVDSLSVMNTDNVRFLDADAVQKLSNNPQLASVVEKLVSSRLEPKMTRQMIGRWKSLPGLLQQTENKTTALSGAQSVVDASSCQDVVRSLGQLGHVPAHQLENQPSNLYWYVFLLANIYILELIAPVSTCLPVSVQVFQTAVAAYSMTYL